MYLRFILVFLLISLPVYADQNDDLYRLSLDELLQVKVRTVSRFEENIQDTPATVIVITQEMIKRRGYKEFSEIFDDLPGIEILRPYGDTWIAHFWRGVSQRGGTVLLMLDGNVMNHLYFDNIFVQSTFSLSNIKQIEVAYGPASVPYGDNALLGTINVITRSADQESGTGFKGFAVSGSNQRKIIDFHQSYNYNDWRFNLAMRMDKGDIDQSYTEDYEYTRSAYSSNPLLWGDFVNNPKFAGGYQSSHDNKSIDFRVGYLSTEIALQHFDLSSGNGSVYATDKVQNRAPWIRTDSIFQVRHEAELSDSILSTSTYRHRRSDIDNDSFFLEGFPFPGVPGGRLIDLSYWRSINRSNALYQDFKYSSNHWNAVFGIRYEKKDLQKAYDITRGEDPFIVPASLTNWQDYDFPSPPVASSIPLNRINVKEKSVYFMYNRSLQPFWDIGEQHLFNIGVRYEDHSVFGSEPIFRTGYVIRDGDYSYKFMWGESFQEPSARLLYGGWQGVGSDPELSPEESSTIEASWNYISGEDRLSIIAAEVTTGQTIQAFSGGASNDPGKRKITSMDIIAQKAFLWGDIKLTNRLNFSHVFDVSAVPRADSIAESFLSNPTKGPTGDIARNKLMLGAELRFSDDFGVTLNQRYISRRYTLAVNPIKEVPSYFVSDLNFQWSNVWQGADLSLKINNLMDKRYFHPGVNSADAGDQPGFFDEDGNWNGSEGFFSSLLPQAGREIFLRLDIRF